MRKTIAAIVAAVALMFTATACTQAGVVSNNVSQDADNFKVIRRLAVINVRSDKPTFEIIGAFSIKVDAADGQLEVVAQTGPTTFKKHFIGINQWVTYVVEDISGAEVSPYRYEVSYLPQSIDPIVFKNGETPR